MYQCPGTPDQGLAPLYVRFSKYGKRKHIRNVVYFWNKSIVYVVSFFLLSIPRHSFLLSLLVWSFFNILIPTLKTQRKKPWTYFCLVKWLSEFPVGARFKEDSWNLERGWCRVQAPAGKVGHPRPIPPYAPPPLLHAQQRGKAGPHNRNISNGRSQEAAPSPILSYSAGRWAVRFDGWFLHGTSQLWYWKCFVNIGQFWLQSWWQKCTKPSLYFC